MVVSKSIIEDLNHGDKLSEKITIIGKFVIANYEDTENLFLV